MKRRLWHDLGEILSTDTSRRIAPRFDSLLCKKKKSLKLVLRVLGVVIVRFVAQDIPRSATQRNTCGGTSPARNGPHWLRVRRDKLSKVDSSPEGSHRIDSAGGLPGDGRR